MATVRLRGIRKTFGEGVTAIAGLDLDIRDREFFSLLGPSGCGKTTLLRIIAGVETPDSGDIFIGDLRVNDLTPRERNIAMVFQNYALYPNMTVRDNIGFPLKLKGVSKIAREKKVLEIAKVVEISELLNRKPKQLSGGQQQRVALARALVREPNLFLLDEPLSNLDAKLRAAMRLDLKRIQSQLGVTTIFVTHDQVEAMTMSERIALLAEEGILKQVGSPHELYGKPSDRFVAEFIGTPAMNFLKCDVNEESGRIALDLGFCTLRVPGKIEEMLRGLVNEEMELGVRPEDLSLKVMSRDGGAKGQVLVAEPTGAEQYVYLSVNNSILVIRAPSEARFQPKETWEIAFNMEKIHLFHKGKAIL